MSALASDDAAEGQGQPSPEEPALSAAKDQGERLSEATQQGDQPPASAPDSAPWLEPQVQSLAIFTELFRAGDRTEAEMEQLLTRYTTTMAWTDFWAREGYITEVVRGSERRFTLSGKAALVLELPD